MMNDKEFPIINSNPKEYIPWEVIQKHEKQAIINHEQSLETLARRGGLSWYEAQCVLSDSYYGITFISDDYSRNAVMDICKRGKHENKSK